MNKAMKNNTPTKKRRSVRANDKVALALGLTVLVSLAATACAGEHHYSFETVVVPDDNFTQLLGINNRDRIVGYHNATNFQGFSLILPAQFTPENFPGSAQTQVVGINQSGYTAGFYIDNGDRKSVV